MLFLLSSLPCHLAPWYLSLCLFKVKALNALLHCTHILSNIKHCWIQQCWMMLETRVVVETLGMSRGTLFSIHTNGTNWQNILARLSGVNEMRSLIGSVGTTCVYLQTCQLSRFYRESHDLLTFSTHSWQDSQCHVFLGNITPKWNVALMNKKRNFAQNARAWLSLDGAF